MRRRALLAAVAATLLAALVIPVWAGGVSARGYTRGDGTYVAPQFRSAPGSGYNNNWSTSPNVNPYTGGQGLGGIPR